MEIDNKKLENLLWEFFSISNEKSFKLTLKRVKPQILALAPFSQVEKVREYCENEVARFDHIHVPLSLWHKEKRDIYLSILSLLNADAERGEG